MKAREARKNQVNTVIKGDQAPPEDRHPRLRHQEGPRSASSRRGQGQGDDHVPWPRAVPPELGFRLLQRLAEDVIELGFVESAPKQDGRNMIMVLGPTKKGEARAEQRRRRETPGRRAPPVKWRDEPALEPVAAPTSSSAV